MTDIASKTILVLAYSISPVRGSEYAVGWNYVTHMAQHHRLIVLYGLAGNHMGDVEEMAGVDSGAFAHPVTFIPVMPNRLARALNEPNRRGVLPYSFYLAYRQWHRQALAVARRIVAETPVDVVHYLCPIGYREPGYLWQLGLPYIWGPIGAMDLRPLRPFFGLGWKEGIKTLVRNVVNGVQFRFNPRLARAFRETDVLLTNTQENAAIVRRVYGKASLVMPENAVTATPVATHEPGDTGVLRLVWAGTIETRKALPILLRALARLDGGWMLDVVGWGPTGEAARTLARDLGIDAAIRWHGKIPREDVLAIFADAQLHVLTSLAEAHTTVLLEAMSFGVPTVAFDHCGMRDSICNTCGVRVPLGSIKQMVERLTAVLAGYVADPAPLVDLSRGALACAERAGWPRRVERWNDIYDVAIEARQARR